MKEFFNVRLRSIRSSRVNSDFLEVGYSSRLHVVYLPCFWNPIIPENGIGHQSIAPYNRRVGVD